MEKKSKLAEIGHETEKVTKLDKLLLHLHTIQLPCSFIGLLTLSSGFGARFGVLMVYPCSSTASVHVLRKPCLYLIPSFTFQRTKDTGNRFTLRLNRICFMEANWDH